MKTKFRVYGWLNGDDYDDGGDPNIAEEIESEDLPHAEDQADELFKQKIGTCDVIEAQPVNDHAIN